MAGLPFGSRFDSNIADVEQYEEILLLVLLLRRRKRRHIETDEKQSEVGGGRSLEGEKNKRITTINLVEELRLQDREF